MSITITDIISEHGAYYKAGGQNVNDLIAMIYQGSVTESYFSPIRTDKTKIDKASAEITSVLQAFQKQFTPKGNTTFKPRSIELQKMKIDVEEYPDDIEQSWLGFLSSNNLDRRTWPFVRYWLQELVLKKAMENWELKEIYYGKYYAPTAGTANPDGKNFDGIRYKINKAIDDGDITVIPSGAWTLSNPVTFVEEVEEWVREIPEIHRMKINQLFMSESLKTTYRSGMREKYNMYYAQAGDLDKVMDTNISIVGLPSMVGDHKIYCSVPMNMVIATKKPENVNVFKVEEAKRLVSAMTDFYKGFGIWLPEYVYTNDLNLGVPVVTSIDPETGDAAGGDTVVITGRDFSFVDEDDATAVRFNAINAASFTVDSDTQITAVTPALTAAAYAVNVKNEFGTGTLPAAFTTS